MKVCFVAPYPPDIGGISDYSFNLISALKKSKGLDVSIISRKVGTTSNKNVFYIISTEKVQRSFFQIFEELRNLPKTFVEVFQTLNIIKKIKPELVHVQYQPGLYNLFFCPLIFLFLKSLDIKILITLHSRDYFPLNIFHRIFLYRLADRILVHSDSHKKLLKMKKVKVVPIGINRMNPGNFSDNK